MQRQITLMCQSETLLSFKTTNFLSILGLFILLLLLKFSFLNGLDGLNTFVNIGEQFSHEPAHKLRGLIKTISKGYVPDFKHVNTFKFLRINESFFDFYLYGQLLR